VSKEKGVVMREEWKQIECAEDGYMVSNLGRVKGIRKPIMGQHDNGIGYLQCKIKMRDGKARFLKVHRMVAIAFIPNPYGLSDVNHIDGNRFNNRVNNLEWLSRADNIRHGFETGLYPTQKNISIVKDGKQYDFRSLCELDRFLHRAEGYTSNRMTKHNDVIDINGNIYQII
jgi:hypothetical protein